MAVQLELWNEETLTYKITLQYKYIKNKRIRMKKIMILAVLAMLVGCGGGSGSASSTYDITDYMTTTNSSIKTWDMYKVGTDGVLNTYFVNILKTTEIHRGDIREIGTVGTFYILNEGIKLSLDKSAPTYKKEIELGKDKLYTCTWTKFDPSMTLENGETFENVLELTCNKFLYYFSKNNGNIAVIQKDKTKEVLHTMVNTITVKNLTIGEILNNDNKLFRLQ